MVYESFYKKIHLRCKNLNISLPKTNVASVQLICTFLSLKSVFLTVFRLKNNNFRELEFSVWRSSFNIETSTNCRCCCSCITILWFFGQGKHQSTELYYFLIHYFIVIWPTILPKDNIPKYTPISRNSHLQNKIKK